MNRIPLALTLTAGLFIFAPDAFAQRGGGGGRGGGFHPGGGGGARPAGGGAHPTPTFQGGGQRPNPGPRPSFAPQPRPVAPQPRPTPQPNFRPTPQPARPQVIYPNQQAVRPSFVPRPNAPVINNRPVVNQQNINNRPVVNNQQNINNRPIINNNRTNVTVNRPTFNRPTAVNPAVVNRPGGVYRPNYNRPVIAGNNAAYRPGYTTPYRQPYYQNYYSYYRGWNHGAWNGWGYRPPYYRYPGAAGWWGNSTTYVYSNPYYVPVPYAVGVLNYSQPIAIPDSAPTAVLAPQSAPAQTFDTPPLGEVQSSRPDDPNANAAAPQFEAARASFRIANYPTALQQIERAIAANPGDPALHEFRALILYALGKYRDAAAGLYAVLATAPGMNWDTLGGFYANPDTYERQLRSLESFVSANPQDGAAAFVLAYHALVLEQFDTAKTYLERVVGMQPNDELAKRMLEAVKQRPQEPQQP